MLPCLSRSISLSWGLSTSKEVELKEVHLNLKATLSGLYAPEIRFEGSFGEPLERATEIRITGLIGRHRLWLVQATGCSPSRNNQSLLFQEENEPFTFVLAWQDKKAAPPPFLSRDTFKSVGLYPFETKLFRLRFSGVGCKVTTSLHIEIPHNLTRYTADTRTLQHMFGEHGLRPPSYMGGIGGDGESFQMHLHYKSLVVFRRIAAPLATMITVFLLDLAVMELAKSDTNNASWSKNPSALLAFLSINAGVFLSLSAIKVGSTLRSLLNIVRLTAVGWVIMLTVAIRAISPPAVIPHIATIVDAGLKFSVIWIFVFGIYSFFPYALVREERKRCKIFAILALIAVAMCASAIVWTKRLDIVNDFAGLIGG